MKTIKSLLTVCLFAICLVGLAQDYKQNIEGEFTEYLNSIVNMEFEKSMGYITPEFFEIVPKSQMIQVMEQTFNNPTMDFEIKNPKILAINDFQKIEDKYYTLLTYSNQMDIKMRSEEEETEDEKKMRLNLTKTAFEQTFGLDNVKYNEETEFFEIQSQKDVYAISINGETDWKFLVIEKNQKMILEKILPKELSEKI